MRPITRRVTAFFLLVALGLLALGAVPGHLGAGDPYYLTATPVGGSGPAVNASDLPERRYPYLTEALADGRSSGYQRGPVGLKEAFTHSPFDEYEALVARNPEAEAEAADAVYVVDGDQRYRVEVRR